METAPPRLVAVTAAGVWAVSAGALYLWRRISLQKARSDNAAALARFSEAARTQFDGLVTQTIGLAAVTLGWAVRAEMVRDDQEDVQEYMQQLAKRPGVRRALVAKADGGVIAASDLDSRGRKLKEIIQDPPSEASAVQVLPRPDGVMRLVIPVMGLEARLGTLIVEYERPVFPAGPRT
jgi:hypothetical protein